MQQDYKKFIDRMIDHYEGGYGWNQSDTGGPTKYGITCYDLAEHRGEKMDSKTRWAPIVKAMTRDEAETIYAEKYAKRIGFDELPAGIDCCVMDYAVNSGYARALSVMCTLLGLDPVRTSVTKAILQRANTVNPQEFVDRMCAERLNFMHSIRHGEAWSDFGKGWGARVADLKHYCEALITNKPANDPPVVEAHPKVAHAKPNAANIAKSAGGAATVGGGASHTTGMPVTVTVILVVVICVLGFVVFYQNRARIAKLNVTALMGTLKPLLERLPNVGQVLSVVPPERNDNLVPPQGSTGPAVPSGDH